MQLGGWVMYRRLLSLAPAAQAEMNIFTGFRGKRRHRLPLVRLRRVSLSHEDGLRVLTLHSPAGSLLVRWDLGSADDAWLCARVIDDLSRRLHALGREYEYALDDDSDASVPTRR